MRHWRLLTLMLLMTLGMSPKVRAESESSFNCAANSGLLNPLKSVVDRFLSGRCEGCGTRKTACEISTSRSLPKIFIVGEMHPDPQSIRIRDRLLKGATEGRFPLASEVAGRGGFFPWAGQAHSSDSNQSLAHGIESPIPSAITSSYRSQDDMLGEKMPLSHLLLRHVLNTSQLPLFRSALEKLKVEAAQKQDRARMELIEKIEQGVKKLPLDASEEEQRRIFLKTIGPAHPKELVRDYLRDHHKAVIEMANQKYLEFVGPAPLIPLLNKEDGARVGLVNGEFVVGEAYSAYRPFIQARDRDFAYSIADVMCEYAGKQPLLFVLVGDHHVSGVKEWLGKLGVDPSRIDSAESFDRDQVKRIENVLDAAERSAVPGP